MTILGLMQEVFPLARLECNPLNDVCVQPNLEYEDARDFWTKDLSEDLIKDIAKRFVNHIYGIPNAHILYHDTDSIEEWQEIPPFMYDNTFQKFIEIMDDAESNGFEFKFKGTKVYYRERPFDSNMNAPVSN